jgi:hypothetical protein
MHTVARPARTEIEVKHVVCDFCKCVIPENAHHDVNEVQITHKTGYRYPDVGCVTTLGFDSCPKCFEEKVAPALKALGAEPSSSDVDF